MERDSSTSWSPTSCHITDGQDLDNKWRVVGLAMRDDGIIGERRWGRGQRFYVVDELRVKQAINFLKRGVRVGPIIFL